MNGSKHLITLRTMWLLFSQMRLQCSRKVYVKLQCKILEHLLSEKVSNNHLHQIHAIRHKTLLWVNREVRGRDLNLRFHNIKVNNRMRLLCTCLVWLIQVRKSGSTLSSGWLKSNLYPCQLYKIKWLQEHHQQTFDQRCKLTLKVLRWCFTQFENNFITFKLIIKQQRV